MSDPRDRRVFKRLNAPLFCRPRSMKLFVGSQRPQDISMGGARIYSDDDVRPGTRLEIELFLPDQSSMVADIEVVWVDPLPAGSPAKFDVGLKFLDVGRSFMDRLAVVLQSEEDEGGLDGG